MVNGYERCYKKVTVWETYGEACLLSDCCYMLREVYEIGWQQDSEVSPRKRRESKC
jgi:hypothetical protein